MKKKLFVSSLIVCLSASSLLFQNCGSKGGDAATAASQIESLDTQDPDPVTPKPPVTPESTPLFKAGDTVTADKLPYNPKADFKTLVTNYLKITGSYKAIAMANDGTGIARSSVEFVTQAEADDVILERCQLASGNKPCSLLARGNKFVYNEKDFYNQHTDVLESGARKFNPKTIPGLAYKWRLYAEGEGYVTRKNKYKAYAISVHATSPGWSEVSQAEADRRAVEYCEATGNLPCTLYASGNNVVFNVSTFVMNKKMVILFGQRAFAGANIPFITDAARINLDKEIKKLVSTDKKQVVLAMSRYGHYYYTSGNKMDAALEKSAVDKCNAAIEAGANFQCFVYSKNLDVIFTRATLEASYKAK